MFGFLKDRREFWLFCGTWIAFALLLVVKIKFDVPETMKDWPRLIAALRSDAFEDIVGDLLTGLIAAYFFYLLIDLWPRYKNEQKAIGILNLLIASVIQAYEKRHFFAHTMAITQADVNVLTKKRIDAFLEEVKEQPDYAKLKCALFTAHSRFADFQQTLAIAAPLGPDKALQWLVITDKVRLFVDEYEKHPESEVYRPSQVFYDDTANLDQGHKNFIRYFSNMTDYRDSLRDCFYEFLEEANKWISPGSFETAQPESIDIDEITEPSLKAPD
ncbi:hypothetical protein [Pseudomonas sp. ES1]|uniref:hypothetical protein n=1 Tax=Pseudomonas sp. ES1 TaxID=3424775 RepID=UPI003D32EDDD